MWNLPESTATRPNTSSDVGPVDAVLVLSFGGPEQPDDVMPFLRKVTGGRNIPDERLAEVAEHYLHFGGRSPINDQARELIDALRIRMQAGGLDLPIYWGNRNWHPFIEDTMAQIALDGRKNIIAFATSAYSSYSSCHQYREDLQRSQTAVGESAPRITKVRQFYNHPGFIEPMIRNTRAAMDALPENERSSAHIAFTAHSIPLTMATNSRYQQQLLEASRLVMEGLNMNATEERPWELVFQSRSGSPHTPWLEPDICDHLQTLHSKGVNSLVMVPIGFISDHMEVVYDLDDEAAKKAADLGMNVTRAKTVGVDDQFIDAVYELIVEDIDRDAQRRSLGLDGIVGCLGQECCVTSSAGLS